MFSFYLDLRYESNLLITLDFILMLFLYLLLKFNKRQMKIMQKVLILLIVDKTVMQNKYEFHRIIFWSTLLSHNDVCKLNLSNSYSSPFKELNNTLRSVNLCSTVLSYDMYQFLQVAHCYPEEMKEFPQDVRDVLQRHSSTIDRTMRMVNVYQPLFSHIVTANVWKWEYCYIFRDFSSIKSSCFLFANLKPNNF